MPPWPWATRLTLVNSVLTRAGKYGGAVRVHGPRLVRDCTRGGRSLNLTSGMTLEAWVRPSKLVPGHATIIAKTRGRWRLPVRTQADRRQALYVWADRLGRFCQSGGEDQASGEPMVVPSRNLRRVYAASLRREPSSGKARRKGGHQEVGRCHSRSAGTKCGGEFFIGSIDNVRIFSKARSPQQLGRDRRTPVGGGLIHGPVSTTVVRVAQVRVTAARAPRGRRHERRCCGSARAPRQASPCLRPPGPRCT